MSTIDADYSPRPPASPGGTGASDAAAPAAWLGWLYVVMGAVALYFSGLIITEKLKLAEDPSYVTRCDINAIVSCSDVMDTWQASVFGFANPLCGLVGFSVVVAIGAAILAGGRFRPWFWFGVQAGMTFAVLFVHWMAFEAIVVIGAICPYCVVVWVMVVPLFVYTTVFTWRRFAPPAWGGGIGHSGWGQHLVVGLWLAALAAAMVLRFWDYLA